MKQGSNLDLKVNLGEVNISLIKKIIFSFKAEKDINSSLLIQKSFYTNSAEVSFLDNNFYIKLSQTDTKELPKYVYLQAQINYTAGGVDFSNIVKINVEQALNVVLENE